MIISYFGHFKRGFAVLKTHQPAKISEQSGRIETFKSLAQNEYAAQVRIMVDRRFARSPYLRVANGVSNRVLLAGLKFDKTAHS